MRFNVGDNPEDYFKVKSEAPKPPEEGQVLITRVRNTNIIKVLHHSGREERTCWEGTHANYLWARKQGIPKDKIDSIMGYVWNFCVSYARISTDDPVAEPM